MTLFNAKILLTTTLFALATTVSSVQATELVKIETINKTEIAFESEFNLTQSMKLIQLNISSAQTTAKSLLAKQNRKLDNQTSKSLVKVSLIAE